MENKRKPIRFGTVLVGLLFFCNPYFAAVDVLPDFIGCLLIWLGLSRIAPLHSYARDAQSAFLKLAGVDAIKSLLLIAVFSMGYGTAEQPTALLVIAFAAGVVELFFLLPALRALFDSFFMLASRYDCTALYANPHGGLSKTDSICRLSMIFVVVREIACLLPEITALSTSSFSDSAFDRIYEFIGIMRLLACVFVALCGLYWVVRLLCYFRKLHREREMLSQVAESYCAYRTAHPGITVIRRHAVSFALLGAGFLLLTDFYLDFANVIPDHVAGILICLGAILPMGLSALRAATAVAAGVYTVVSFVSSDLSATFALQFTPNDLGKNHEADLAYTEMWIWALVELIAFFALLVCLLLLLRGIVREWAGYRAMHNTEEKGFEDRAHRSMLERFDSRILLCSVLGFFAGLASFLFDYLQMPPLGRWIDLFFDYFWMLDFGFSLLFAVAMWVLLTRIYTEIKNRYRYD